MEYRTNNLPLASYLSLRYQLIRVETTSRGRAYFVFASTPELETEVMAYLSRETRVEPVAFYEQTRALKSATQ